MPDQSPILSLPLILPAQAQKHVTHNEALRLLDVMVQLAVLNRNLSAPTALPSVGDRHIIAAGAVGAWAGQVGKVALYTATGWQFFAPLPGWQAYVLAEAVTVVFAGTAWAEPNAAASAPMFGVNTTADAVNRLAVQSAANLLNHDGAGHQLKLNKAAVDDTGSLLFQNGFSGRAEMGLAGSDAFSIKASADGTAWVIDAGAVTLAKMASVATDTFLGRDTAGTGAPEVMTPGQARAILNVADGATANSPNATLLDRANHSGVQVATSISDFNEAAQDAIGAMVDASLIYSDATPSLARAALTGDVTAPAGSNALTIANNSVSNVKLADMAPATIKGNNAGVAGDPVDLTGAQTTAMLDAFTTVLKGLVPPSGGGTTTFLRADGTFAAPAGGGGGSPGGASGQVQFNNAAAFGGASNVEIDGGNLKLLTTTDPAAPIGGLLLYAKSIAGRVLPKIIGPVGIDTVLQTGLHGNSVFMIAPANSTTAPTVIGGTLTALATISHVQTIASVNPWLATRKTRFQTSTVAGNASGGRTGYGQWFLGNALGFGGFFFRVQIGMNINLAGGQKFCGLGASTVALAGEPSALLNMCGMGYDAADLSTGNWQFMRNDGAGVATKVDLGANAARNTTHGYDLIMFVKPNSSELFVRIVNLHTNVTVLDASYTTDLPVVNNAMAFRCDVRNGAVAAADNIEIAKAYIETDY